MQKTSSLLMKYAGSTSKQAIPAAFLAATDTASDNIEKKYPKVTEAKIQGSNPHISSNDPSDGKEVITISYHTANGTRVTSVHVHNDNTFKEFPSRNANKGK